MPAAQAAGIATATRAVHSARTIAGLSFRLTPLTLPASAGSGIDGGAESKGPAVSRWSYCSRPMPPSSLP